MRWKIFYSDGTEFSNQDGNPEDAPGLGVMAVAQENSDVGVSIHSGKDFYVFDEDYEGWFELDEFGLTQYLAKPGFKIIKLGKVMGNMAYFRLLQRIRNDPDLPAKSAKYSWERPISD